MIDKKVISEPQDVQIIMRIHYSDNSHARYSDITGIELYFGIMKNHSQFTFEKFMEIFLWESVTKHIIDYDSIVEDWDIYPTLTEEALKELYASSEQETPQQVALNCLRIAQEESNLILK